MEIFLVTPLKEQLTTIFVDEKVWRFINSPDVNQNSISDVIDGCKYKEKGILFPHSISLTCNTDGVPVFSSSNASLWPVYYTINELPIIYRRRYVILHALWSGTGKPNIDCLLKPVV